MTKLFPIFKFTVFGNSMFPTLKEGQKILSFNWAYLGKKPKIGDIVVVKSEKFKVKSDIVKRVVKVEEDLVFLEGDNKSESTDSRHLGPVDSSQIIGKVIFGPKN